MSFWWIRRPCNAFASGCRWSGVLGLTTTLCDGDAIPCHFDYVVTFLRISAIAGKESPLDRACKTQAVGMGFEDIQSGSFVNLSAVLRNLRRGAMITAGQEKA